MVLDFTFLALLGGILGFGFLVLVHEFGHFAALKIIRTPVHAFSVGFGSPVWSGKFYGTELRLGWIPLGGYVMPEDPAEVEKREEAGESIFPGYPPSHQFFVAFMGPLANLILAFFLFAALNFVWGEPHPVPVVESVIKGSPAFVAGLHPGDRIEKINGFQIGSWKILIEKLQENGLNSGFVEIVRQERQIMLPFTPIREGNRWVIGIKPKMEASPPTGFVSAMETGFARTIQETVSVFEALGRMLSFSGAGNVSGPIGVLGYAVDAFKGGMMAFLTLLAILSVNLAVFNLLPIPPLDGIRIFVAFWQALSGKPPKEKILLPIYQWGAMGLAVLFLLVTLKDLGNFLL